MLISWALGGGWGGLRALFQLICSGVHGDVRIQTTNYPMHPADAYLRTWTSSSRNSTELKNTSFILCVRNLCQIVFIVFKVLFIYFHNPCVFFFLDSTVCVCVSSWCTYNFRFCRWCVGHDSIDSEFLLTDLFDVKCSTVVVFPPSTSEWSSWNNQEESSFIKSDSAWIAHLSEALAVINFDWRRTDSA